MRTVFAAAVVVMCALMGAAGSRTSAQSQSTPAGITLGEKLTIYFDRAHSGFLCTVADVRGGFLRCKDEAEVTGFGRRSTEHWYNLQKIDQIDRPARQE